jgi:cytidylate kinase
LSNFCEEGVVIAVSGKPGSGKSTLARNLAEKLGLRYVSVGQIFRRIASSIGVSLEELSRIAEKDDSIDRMIDSTAVEEARRGCVVLDGHLSAWILKDLAHVKIMTYAPLSVRAMRIARRDGKNIEEALHEIEIREDSETRRYLRYYGININDISVFDLIVNTSNLSEEETTQVVLEAVKVLLERRLREKLKSS